MRKCVVCKLLKSTREYHKSKRDGWQRICKLCRKANDRKRYLTNPRKKELNAIWRKERAELIASYKAEKGCKYCPENDPCCLDFHHVDEKIDEISDISHRWSLEKLMTEISKCEVVCSNCHRKLHAGRILPHGCDGKHVSLRN
jgi:hypothetical protein